MRALLAVSTAVAVVIIPLAIITTVVLALMYDPSYFEAGQRRFHVDQTTGLSFPQIDRVDVGIVRFFRTDESLPAALSASGASPDVFKVKEVLHMNDVRGIVRLMARAEIFSLVVVAGCVALWLATWRQGGALALSHALVYSAIFTIVLGLVVGVVTYFAFDALFLTFHELVFQNNYWMLDPRTDHLIQLFPFEFWYDAMIAVASRVVGVVVVAGAAGLLLGRVERRTA